MRRFASPHLLTLLLLAASFSGVRAEEPAEGQEKPKSIPAAPDRSEGEGPFDRLILRGAILVDGTGAPPRGPVDIVIAGNRIVKIEGVGARGCPSTPTSGPRPRPTTASWTSRACTCCQGWSTCTATSAASSRARERKIATHGFRPACSSCYGTIGVPNIHSGCCSPVPPSMNLIP